jgi:hypothetical protein
VIIRSLSCLAFVFAVVSGTLLDTTTGQPMSGVHVALRGPSAARTTSDKQGRFMFRMLQPGRYTLVVESHDVPRQTRSFTLRTGQRYTTKMHVCSTTLDYSCGGGGSPGAGGAGA